MNPRIVESDGEWVFEEGCLSVPGLSWEVVRPKTVHLVGVDLDGNELSIEADELEARLFQHELDHLDGILIVDHAGLDELPSDIANLERPYHEARQARAFARRVYQGETLYY